MVGCFAGARIMRATHVQGGCCNTCAVLDDGRLFCWGEDYAGELGDGAINGGSPQPQQVVLPEAVVDLSLGPRTVCAYAASGTMWCWGANDVGEVGDGSITTQIGRASC